MNQLVDFSFQQIALHHRDADKPGDYDSNEQRTVPEHLARSDESMDLWGLHSGLAACFFFQSLNMAL